MPADSQYHVRLDGQGFIIDPPSYRGKPATTFAAKLQVGDTTYRSLVGASAWAQSEWIDGVFEGSQEYDRTKKQQRAADAYAVDISFGDVRLGRSFASVFATEAILDFAVYAGAVYAIAQNSANVYRSTDGITWALSVNLNSLSPVTKLGAIAAVGDGLFVWAGDSGKIFRYDGTAWIAWKILALDWAGSGHSVTDAPTAVTALDHNSLPNPIGCGVV